MEKIITKRESWAKSVLQTFSSQLAIICINLLSGVLLARGMGVEGRGQLVSITMWSNLLYWTMTFGLYQAVLYFMKQYNGNKSDIFRTFTVYAFMTSVAAIIVAETVIVPIVTNGFDEAVIFAARIYFVGIIFTGFADILMAALASVEKFGYSNVFRLAVPGLSTLIMLILFIQDVLTAETALYGAFCTTLLLFLVNVVTFIRSEYTGGQVDWTLMRQAFKYGAKAHGGTVAGLMSTNSSQMTISIFLSPSTLGLYTIANSSVTPLNTITSTIGITAQPILTADDKDRVHMRVMEIVRKSIFIIGLSSCLLAGLLPWLIPLVYGGEFIGAIIPALILLPSVLFNCISTTYRNALNGAGLTFSNTKAEVIVLGCTALLLGIFLPLWQLEGAAIATTISSVIRFLIFFKEYRRHMSNTSLLAIMPRWKDVRAIYSASLEYFNKRLNRVIASKRSI